MTPFPAVMFPWTLLNWSLWSLAKYCYDVKISVQDQGRKELVSTWSSRKEYEPQVFRRIREHFKIDDAE